MEIPNSYYSIITRFYYCFFLIINYYTKMIGIIIFFIIFLIYFIFFIIIWFNISMTSCNNIIFWNIFIKKGINKKRFFVRFIYFLYFSSIKIIYLNWIWAYIIYYNIMLIIIINNTGWINISIFNIILNSCNTIMII